MSERTDFAKAIASMKLALDKKREDRRAEERADIRRSFTRERTGEEGLFRVRDSAPVGVRLSFIPFSARVQTIFRKGYTKPIYRDRDANRFITAGYAGAIRSENRARTAYNTMRSRFPNLTHDEAVDRVNRLTELSISRQLGEDVDIEIAELFGYPM